MTAIQPKPSALGYVAFDIHDGVGWLQLNDHVNYRLGAGSFESVAMPRKRHTVTSSMYDGEWEVHSTAGNVTETVVINILGVDQNHVTENWLRMKEAFDQPYYNVRKILDNHQETWRCFPPEYQINRGQIQAHAVRMQVTLTIPRFPKATYEVVS